MLGHGRRSLGRRFRVWDNRRLPFLLAEIVGQKLAALTDSPSQYRRRFGAYIAFQDDTCDEMWCDNAH